MSTLEGHQVRQWIERVPSNQWSALIGFHADDGKCEWQIVSAADTYFSLRQVASDGETLLTQLKKLPLGALDGYAFWHPRGDETLIDEILASRSVVEVNRERVHTFLLDHGFPAGHTLPNSDEAELAAVLRRLDVVVDAKKIRAQDMQRIAEICDGNPTIAMVGARWIQAALSRCAVPPSLAIQCRIHMATLYRHARRPKDALAATSPYVKSESAGQLSPPTIATICLIRAAAMMDLYEINPLAKSALMHLNRADILLKRAYRASGGGGTYQQAAFWRLRALIKTRPPT